MLICMSVNIVVCMLILFSINQAITSEMD